jgi:septum formation protein
MARRIEIVLASASPRRSELLESAGISFKVVPSSAPEELLQGETPIGHVKRLAREKAAEVAPRVNARYVIGADTVVVCNGEIMGKPGDIADATRMLNALSGISHEVITGFAILDCKSMRDVIDAVTTKVYFKQLNDREIADYIATGCPFDKAGAYAIQGGAAYMVERIEGSYTNVVGLPLCEVVATLKKMGAID